MGVMKDLHYELSQYITDEKDQDTVLELFWELKDGGTNSQTRKENAKKIIDLRSIYGEDLDNAITMLLEYKNL